MRALFLEGENYFTFRVSNKRKFRAEYCAQLVSSLIALFKAYFKKLPIKFLFA